MPNFNEPKPDRDLCGYGQSPPMPNWPGKARLALNFVVNLEEGAEHSLANGDFCSENYLIEIANRQKMDFERDFSSESIFEYGSRRGIWRLLNLFEARGLPLTLFACGKSLELLPELTAHLSSGAHEVAGHGYRWIDYREVPINLERAHIRRTIEVIESRCGQRPIGWYTGRRSQHTRALLINEGILYDSESYSDDLPYWEVLHGGKAHLIIPYTFDVNDAKYCLAPGWTSGEDFLSYLKNTVCCLYREGETSPKMMTVALHARISGRPGRAEVIHQFLDFIQAYPDLWITTRKKIAEFWYTQHPFS